MNWAPPAKMKTDMTTTDQGGRPLPAAIAPNEIATAPVATAIANASRRIVRFNERTSWNIERTAGYVKSNEGSDETNA
ncbi:hypothetical protein JCM9534A_26230 [Catenuloplanes indicus JCM 9534]